MKVFFFITLLYLFSAPLRANAEDQSLRFEKKVHDFGTIQESSGKVTYEFKFTNKGKTPIIITEVKASCGCTTPSWTRSAIEPGYTGYIKAVFDPNNRPNAFTKTLSVSYKVDQIAGVELLTIKGFVVLKPKIASDLFPITNGSLRFASDYLNLGSIDTKGPVKGVYKIYNDGLKRINFLKPSNLSKHLTVSITPIALNPKDTGYINVIYNPKGKEDFGYVYDVLFIETDDTLPVKKLFIVADISQYFAPMSKADSLAMPKLSFDRSTHDFGKITQGEIVSTNFELSNRGKSDLIIYKTKASCGCTASELEKKVIKSGEKTTLKITFDSSGKMGEDSKSITVYCNDPSYSEAMVVIRSDIQASQNKDTTSVSPK